MLQLLHGLIQYYLNSYHQMMDLDDYLNTNKGSLQHAHKYV